MPKYQNHDTQTEEKEESTLNLSRKEQVKQLDSLLDMYRTCLRKQSNYARMFAGTAQATPYPGAGGLYMKHANPANYRESFESLEPVCDAYKQEWDQLYKQIYKPKSAIFNSKDVELTEKPSNPSIRVTPAFRR